MCSLSSSGSGLTSGSEAFVQSFIRTVGVQGPLQAMSSNWASCRGGSCSSGRGGTWPRVTEPVSAGAGLRTQAPGSQATVLTTSTRPGPQLSFSFSVLNMFSLNWFLSPATSITFKVIFGVLLCLFHFADWFPRLCWGWRHFPPQGLWLSLMFLFLWPPLCSLYNRSSPKTPPPS